MSDAPAPFTSAELPASWKHDTRVSAERLRATVEALEAANKNAVLTEAWLISRIDEELKREGLPALSWTDGGGASCPTGWHRNPYLNSGKVEKLTTALNELLGFAERNWRRAQLACSSAKVNRFDGTELSEEVRVERLVLEGREHEALRFYNVVRDRVAEALR
jgi:hypothetical protein